MGREYKFERIDEKLTEAKSKANGIINKAEVQRDRLAEWARDSDNRQLASPSASDNRVRLRPLIRSLRDINLYLDDISSKSAEQAEKKSNFYKRIQELKDKKYEIDTHNNLDGKEDLAREIIQLIDDIDEWIQNIEDKQS